MKLYVVIDTQFIICMDKQIDQRIKYAKMLY